MKADQDLQMGPLCPAALTIPKVFAISQKILQKQRDKNRAAKIFGPRGIKALNTA